VSFEKGSLEVIQEIAKKLNCNFEVIGRVVGDRLRISTNGEEAVNLSLNKLEDAWRVALPRKLQAEAMVAGKE
jgi:phosphoribosylformylglycinamidine (FGAM) synthase-like enzyme